MELRKVQKGSWVRVLSDEGAEAVRVPPAAPEVSAGEPIFFYHIDGMYSLCQKNDGTTCHLLAWQEVEVLDPQPPAPVRRR